MDKIPRSNGELPFVINQAYSSSKGRNCGLAKYTEDHD